MNEIYSKNKENVTTDKDILKEAEYYIQGNFQRKQTTESEFKNIPTN